MSTVVAKNISVQNSAGTASANISFDGSKLVGSQPFDGLGVGQTWQDVTASRAVGVTYTNNTGKPIIAVLYGSTPFPTTAISAIINGYEIVPDTTGNNGWGGVSVLVPKDATYQFTIHGGVTITISRWSELR